jgi:hypothetical protein
LVARVEAALGRSAKAWRKPHTGVTPAQRFVVTFVDGSTAFVKAPVDAQTSEWSRMEHHVLSHLGADYAPRVLYADDSLLVTEDLSGAYWPADNPGPDGAVTWLPGQVDALLTTLRAFRDAAPGLELPALASGKPPVWPGIAADPERYGVVPRHWLAPLCEAEAAIPFAGAGLVHNDVRSDNVCFADRRVVLVDWTNARRGNPLFDQVELALTYSIEGGPAPWELVADADLFPIWQAGFLLARSVDLDGVAPAWLVAVFRRLATVAVAWSARVLNLRA